MSFKVAVIRPTNIVYGDHDMNYSKWTNDRILDDIEDSIELINIENPDDFLNVIAKTLDIKDNQWGDTLKWYDDKYVYEICFNDDYYKENKNVNSIAMYLTDKLLRLSGSVIMLKTKIRVDGTMTNCDLLMSDIVSCYQKKFVHTGQIIQHDGKIDTVKYMINPIDWINPNEVSNYRYFEVELYDKIAMFFIELVPKIDNINEKATILYGKPIKGRVIVAMRNRPEDIRQSENIYFDFTENMFEKLLAIMSVPKDSIMSNVVVTKDKNGKVIDNFHILLENKYNAYKNKFGKGYSLDRYKTIISEYTKLSDDKKVGVSIIALNDSSYESIKLK